MRNRPAADASVDPPIRALFVLPGLHRVNRGAEVAFESIARELTRGHGFDVAMIGSGDERPGEPYRFLHASCVDRAKFERYPKLPVLRNETVYEELTFVPGLLRRYDPRAYDVTIGCSYPFVNWALRARSRRRGGPAHVFVTENGDWPCVGHNSEYRYFSCDGLVCTNPEHFERNRTRWRSVLIPNGVDPERFSPGPPERSRFGLPADVPVVLMVSALIETKRVLDGIRAMAKVDGLHLVVAGDGPLRDDVDRLAASMLPGRFHRLAVRREDMPDLYRSSTVFLHMSRNESSPNAFMEASAVGLPVVAHDAPLTRWTFESLAELVDTDDLAAVARALRVAVERAERGRDQRVDLIRRRFSWSGLGAQYAEFLRAVVADRRAARDGRPGSAPSTAARENAPPASP